MNKLKDTLIHLLLELIKANKKAAKQAEFIAVQKEALKRQAAHHQVVSLAREDLTRHNRKLLAENKKLKEKTDTHIVGFNTPEFQEFQKKAANGSWIHVSKELPPQTAHPFGVEAVLTYSPPNAAELLADPSDTGTVQMLWCEAGQWQDADGDLRPGSQVTHWMPLPEAPAK